MLFDLKFVLYFFSILIVPCLGWVWRISTHLRLQQSRIDALGRDVASMPTHKTIHSIEKSLIRIEGNLNLITAEINHLSEKNKDIEDTFKVISLEGKNDKST